MNNPEKVVMDVRLVVETEVDRASQREVTELEWAVADQLRHVSMSHVIGTYAKVEAAEIRATYTHPERFPNGVPDG